MAEQPSSSGALSGAEPVAPSSGGIASGDDRTASENDGRGVHADRLGSIVGGFELRELLGRGGAASVYRAVHPDGRMAAIKILHAEHTADDRARKRLLREAYLANRIGHPGVARVLGDGMTEDGAAYLVLELCEGETLQHRQAANNGLSIEDVVQWTDELLDVLAIAHNLGIVHRDIKPGNLLITRHGGLKVLDFGIARVTAAPEAPSLVTRTGAVLGTPQFMPPEQALGCTEDIDPRSDLWSVGATMFTLLTRRYVHSARNVNEALVLAATQQAPKVRSIRADLPAAVAAVVDRALAFDRRARFRSAREMQDALRRAMQGEGVEARKDESIKTLPEESTPERVRAEVEGEDGDFEFRPRKWWLGVLAAIALATMWGAAIELPNSISNADRASVLSARAAPCICHFRSGACADGALPPPTARVAQRVHGGRAA